MFKNVIQLLTTSFKNEQAVRFCTTINARPRKSTGRAIGPFGWSLLVVPAATFGLGTWQVQRKTWKEGLIQELHNHVQTIPVSLPNTLDQISELEYYPVHVKGQFLHDKEIHMGPRTLLTKGDAASTSSLISNDQNKTRGYLVVTPFKLADRDETILINRGWVPNKYRHPKTRPKGQVEGVVDVIGIVRLHENRPNFVPANKESNDSWFYRDLNQMAAVTGSSPIFLDATTDFPLEHGPIAGQTRISLRNEHMSYIITWYSLSMLTSYMWFTKFMKK